MGLFGTLLEILKAVAPHAAPHVVKGVADAARQRMSQRAGPEEDVPPDFTPILDALSRNLTGVHNKLSALEERATRAEEQAAVLEGELARLRAGTRNLLIGLVASNVVIIGVLVYLLVRTSH